MKNIAFSVTWGAMFNSVISGFRHEVDENCALLGGYATSSGNLLRTFQDNLLPTKMGPIGRSETSVRN